MTAAQSLATFYVLPAVIALLGSYMICREEQEDNLKSLRLIPVDEVKLTLAKMILPDDGKRKKAVVTADTFSCAYEAAALIFRAAVSFVYLNQRRPNTV